MKNKYKITLLIISLIIVTLTTIASYAYFTASVAGNNNVSQNIITSGTMQLLLTDGPKITMSNITPGSTVTKTFKVKNIGSLATNYDIYFSNIINTFIDKSDLVYELTTENGCSKEESVIPSTKQDAKMISSCNIGVNQEHEYELKITFKEDGTIQDDNKGKSFQATISINDYQSNLAINPIIVNNVEELKSTNYNVGDYASTLGYYNPNDDGDASYIIESNTGQTIDNGSYIELNNGNIAKLLVENKTINIKQFGARGNNTSDDSIMIENAFKQLENNEVDTVFFPSGNYVITKSILMFGGNYIGTPESTIVVKGKDTNKEATLYNEFENHDKMTINISNLNYHVDTDDTFERLYLIRLVNTDYSSIKNTKITTSNTTNTGVYAIDLYSDNDNFLIDNLDSRIYTSNNIENSHIAIREVGLGDASTSNITVKNSYLAKNGIDESIWADGWNGTVDNVDINNLTIKDEGIAAITASFVAGESSANHLYNLKFHNNQIIKDNYSYQVISMGHAGYGRNGTSIEKNIEMYDNNIIINSPLESGVLDGAAVFSVGDYNVDQSAYENILIHDNYIDASNCSISNAFEDKSLYGTGIVKNNTVKISGPIQSIYDGLAEVEGGTILTVDESKPQIRYVFRNCTYVHDLTIDVVGMAVQDWDSNRTSTYRNVNFSSTLYSLMFGLDSTKEQTVIIENSTLTHNLYAFGAYYIDLDSQISNNKIVKVIIRNSNIPNPNYYGSVNVIQE